MDRGTWWAAVHGVARSRTRLSDLTFSLSLGKITEDVDELWIYSLAMHTYIQGDSLMVLVVKNLPANAGDL